MRTPSDVVVTVQGLRKSYGARTVVAGLDLEVREGEVVGLIGTNGAGKTTTVECIQGLRRPDAGTLRVFGLDPVRDGERVRRLIGSQLQDSGLPDRLRVGEALTLFGGRRRSGGAELLERFGLAQRRRSAFGSLSGGERQRLFLVLALLGDPRLVIVDELTQGLDPAARRNVWTAVDELRQDGATVLLVTHELDEAEALCDRVVAMRAGRIVDEGAPAELIDRHARWATIRVGLEGDASRDAALVRRLAGVAGVERVARVGGRIELHGDRRAIAHVGAALVAAGSVPADLSVRMPNLQDALLGLLEGGDVAPAASACAGGARTPSAIEIHPLLVTDHATRDLIGAL